MKNILVTGGAGFIGSNFVRHFLKAHPDMRVVNFDKLTYAGNLENLRDVAGNPQYLFVRGDICDGAAVEAVLKDQAIDAIVHFAAESHVDRSILGAGVFVTTNVAGTQVLLDNARHHGVERFVHVSTDEVYGSLGADGNLPKRHHCIPTVRMQPAKRHRISLRSHASTPSDCLWLLRAVRTIMDPTSFLRS